MFKRVALVFSLVLCGTMACRPGTPAGAVRSPEVVQECEVLKAVSASLNLSIYTHFRNNYIGSFYDRIESMPGIKADTLADFVAKNQQPPYWEQDLCGDFVSTPELWSGMVTRVGFSRKKDQAVLVAEVVSRRQGQFDRFGHDIWCVLLSKKQGVWVVEKHETIGATM